MKKTIFSILTLVVALQTNAQVFIGSGFAEVSDFTTHSALDDGAGFSFQIEKDYNLSKTARLKMHPNINISFLYSNVDRNGFPSYLNVISLSPKISYEVLSKERLKIAPFANPFTSYLLGLQSNDFFFESETINYFKWGIEGGVRVDFIIDKTILRLIPLSAQRSIEDFYMQGMISLMVKI